MGRLDSRVAFITGAGAGIARVAADLFSREGAGTVLADINEEAGLATEKALHELGRQALFIRTDVTQEESVRAALEQGMRKFGKLDVLFNCAAPGGSRPKET